MIAKPNQLLVSAIKNGTVIDHIPAGQALKIVRLLNLPAHKKTVTIGLNLKSRALGSKDLIKVEERELTEEEAGRVAIIAPTASINIIRNYSVTKKFAVKMPEAVKKIIVCPNLKCITNHELIETLFKVSRDKQVKLACAYCEKIFVQDEIQNYNV